MKDWKLNLQMFADENVDALESAKPLKKVLPNEEEEEEEDIEEDEEDFEEEEEEEVVVEELPEEGETPKKVLSKEQKAIIKAKTEVKQLKELLQAKETKELEQELEVEEVKRVGQLKKQGLSDQDAEIKAKDESEVKKLRLKLTKMELDKLEDKHAGISVYAKKLSEDKQKFPEFSLEQLYLANYSKDSNFDKKTKMEQEIFRSNANAKSKSLESGTTKSKEPVKLSSSDIRAYNYRKRTNPSLTKKEYLDSILKIELE